MITGAQIAAARRLLGWSYATLAKQANASKIMLAKVERGDTTDRVERTRVVVQRALEAAGIIFIDENGERLGVRLRKQEGGQA